MRRRGGRDQLRCACISQPLEQACLTLQKRNAWPYGACRPLYSSNKEQRGSPHSMWVAFAALRCFCQLEMQHHLCF
jgi:hypothetical protein